jgi:tetratricopeptide (TPR) repeat protein
VPPVFDDSPKQQIRRTITFAGNFRAVDARTGEMFLLQPFDGQKLEDKKPIPVVGPSRGPVDLVPEEKFVKESLDREVTRFVGRMVPARLSERMLVKSSSNPECIKGVELVRDDPLAALSHFMAALAKDKNDDRAAFGAGVALERMGRFPEAKQKYQLAKDLSKTREEDTNGMKAVYNAAYNRVLERIEQGAQNGKAPTTRAAFADRTDGR